MNNKLLLTDIFKMLIKQRNKDFWLEMSRLLYEPIAFLQEFFYYSVLQVIFTDMNTMRYYFLGGGIMGIIVWRKAIPSRLESRKWIKRTIYLALKEFSVEVNPLHCNTLTLNDTTQNTVLYT